MLRASSNPMNTGEGIGVAVAFFLSGMLLAISFLEAPLKFRAPNVTLRIGLGIGRLVCPAINTVEVGFAVVLLSAIPAVAAGARAPARIVAPFAVAVAVAFAVLSIQPLVVRPGLTRRGYC